MDDPAYKRLFSRPRMVRDLLHGFAARDWSADLDLASLAPLPASYVSHDLRQRHGDLVWRVRFKDDRWLYVVLLLEFQSAVDRSMAVRMLAYTALLYQKLIAEGVLRERSGLPPVLPVVIYNGWRPWTAPADVAALIASARGAALARYQPSQRYFLLDEDRVGGADLSSGNLLSALIALETNRDRLRAPELLGALRALIDLLRKQDDEELTAAVHRMGGAGAVAATVPRVGARPSAGARGGADDVGQVITSDPSLPFRRPANGNVAVRILTEYGDAMTTLVHFGLVVQPWCAHYVFHSSPGLRAFAGDRWSLAALIPLHRLRSSRFLVKHSDGRAYVLLSLASSSLHVMLVVVVLEHVHADSFHYL